MNEKNNIIMANVYLKSKSGHSLLNSTNPISNPEPYFASDETISKAIELLQEQGFKIEAKGLTLSISAPQAVFEKAFNVKISYKKAEKNMPVQITCSKDIMNIEGYEHIIEGVKLAVPGFPF